jgi:hypothetical protein
MSPTRAQVTLQPGLTVHQAVAIAWGMGETALLARGAPG